MTALKPLDARTVLQRIGGRTVLVVGDLMLDEWIWGTVTRISPEAPVPVVAVNDHSFTLGGAGNVASNLRALGAEVSFACTIGDDDFAPKVRELLRSQGVDDAGVTPLQGRPTTRKTRVVAHSQQVVRADWESVAVPPDAARARVTQYVRQRAPLSDAVVFSDYGKGLLSREIVEAAQECPLVLADPKPQNIGLFAGVTCVAPNAAETATMTGVDVTDEASLETAARRLLDIVGCRYAVITRGEHGMALFGRDGERLQVPSVARAVYDVSGAGDTVIAMLTLALAAGASIERAVRLANFAAGTVVEKLGTATASSDEIVAMVERDGV